MDTHIVHPLCASGNGVMAAGNGKTDSHVCRGSRAEHRGRVSAHFLLDAGR